MKIGICNCGEGGRYLINDSDGVPHISCNKYQVCPTYSELLAIHKSVQSELSELKSVVAGFKDFIDFVNKTNYTNIINLKKY